MISITSQELEHGCHPQPPSCCSNKAKSGGSGGPPKSPQSTVRTLHMPPMVLPPPAALPVNLASYGGFSSSSVPVGFRASEAETRAAARPERKGLTCNDRPAIPLHSEASLPIFWRQNDVSSLDVTLLELLEVSRSISCMCATEAFTHEVLDSVRCLKAQVKCDRLTPTCPRAFLCNAPAGKRAR